MTETCQKKTPININNYPTLTQSTPKSTVSKKYSFVPTKHVIELLRQGGWEISKINQAAAYGKNQGYQKHMVRFRNKNLLNICDTAPEIILTNSHNAKSSFCIMSGLIKFACLNGLVVSSGMFAEHKINHIGYTDKKVIDAMIDVMESVPKISRKVVEFSRIRLESKERVILAESASILQWEKDILPEPEELLKVHRPVDLLKRNELFTTFNIIQENMIRGGVKVPIRYNPFAGGNKNAKRKSRAIHSISENIRINRSLWELTEKMAGVLG